MTDDAHLLDSGLRFYSFTELLQCSRLDEGFVIACVDQGIAEVQGKERKSWRFQTDSVLKLQKAWRLHRDLDVQISSLALVLDLLQELEEQRRENRFLRQRLCQWELP